MRTFYRALLVGSSLGIATAAPAQDQTITAAIAAKDFAKAERVLLAERRTFPDHVDLTLTLASLYRHTGRVEQARSLYAEILARPNQSITIGERTGSSHRVASAALKRLPTKLSAR